MSATRIFESFKRPATKDEIAAHLAEETIREHEAERIGREHEPWNDRDQDRMARLAALLTGPRQHAVKPVVARLWPDFVKVCEQKVGNA